MALPVKAQRFYNLTASQVSIDSLLPNFQCCWELGQHYADSSYSVSICYPEFVAMSDDEVARYHELTDDVLPELPVVCQQMRVVRKSGQLLLSFVPLVYRDGRYEKLVSFMLKVTATARPQRHYARRSSTNETYTSQSVLSKGTWAKIRIPSSGIYQLSDALLKSAGFTDVSKVKIYGYGGGLQPEVLTADYLAETDDLKEVPTCTVNGRRLFYGVGPVTWNDNHQRVRNPYSDYGYYFLTSNDSTATMLKEDEFISTYYPRNDDYCALYEVDDFAWFEGGRNLYDAKVLAAGSSYKYTVASTGNSAHGTLTVCLSASGGAAVDVTLNDSVVGSISVSKNGNYESMMVSTKTFEVANLQLSNEVVLKPSSSSGTVRLDYISTYAESPKSAPTLDQSFDVPEYLYHITNQNHHGATAADMIIIIPTTQKMLAQAERLKTLHEQYDSLRVRIVPADELFNEFSSGTPDANAYRRYLKMLYDRAESEDDMPRYLLLFGDGAWDNRMKLTTWSSCSPDDFLLCYESENSYSKTSCYVTDDYFCMLDDGEGGNLLFLDMADVAVGRITARSNDDASIVVDKIERYMKNEDAGNWQNTICFMGDDGNQNQHMDDANTVATMVETSYPDYIVKRIMWDAFERVSSSTGNSYPEATRLIKQQMEQGALLMNYSGHGGPNALSHEYVIKLADIQSATSKYMPVWMTASCDLMPFDGTEDNIGEAAFFNQYGVAIAFYGTTRTVYQSYNRMMNLAFTKHLLADDEQGKPMPIGEAVRLTKNELISSKLDQSANKLQYTLLGDPALRLAKPTRKIKVDSINGVAVTDDLLMTLKAGSTATFVGKVLNADGVQDSTFNGLLTALVRDVKEEVVCKLNDTSADGADEPFVYYDRLNNVFSGSNTVSNGQFTFTFAVPKDIKYSDDTGLVNIFAVSDDNQTKAHGLSEQLAFNGSEEESGQGLGPGIYCYLNSTSFVNGGDVNITPYFFAELNDDDGINASGSGIGHDLQLIIDGDMQKTYSLNDYFQFDFGSYTSGKVGYSIPELTYGEHHLLFRAWDVLNNPSTAELTFNVVKGLEPVLVDIECTPNPASTQTTFRIVHDRTGSKLNIKLDLYDTSGRHLWCHEESGTATSQTYTVNWNLTIDNGRRLPTGLYVYRLSISADGSSYTSKAKKLIVFTNK